MSFGAIRNQLIPSFAEGSDLSAIDFFCSRRNVRLDTVALCEDLAVLLRRHPRPDLSILTISGDVPMAHAAKDATLIK